MGIDEPSMDPFFEEAARRLRWSPAQVRRYLELATSCVSFDGRVVIDIGAGNGLFSAYAALSGASSVIAVDPHGPGSNTEMAAASAALRRTLGERARAITFLPAAIDDVWSTLPAADVVLIHNTINHLNEPACQILHKSPEARREYAAFFARLAVMCSPGAMLVVADCSSRNVFGLLGLRSPFAPTINWKIHQPPGRWASLMEEAGFRVVSLTWDAPRIFGSSGQLLLGNRVGGFLTNSHFVLQARRVSAPVRLSH